MGMAAHGTAGLLNCATQGRGSAQEAGVGGTCTKNNRATCPKTGHAKCGAEVTDAYFDACRQRVQPKRGLVQEAGGVSGSSTEGSRASRPKRAVHRFDYNVLNGTSGNLGAMLQAGQHLIGS